MTRPGPGQHRHQRPRRPLPALPGTRSPARIDPAAAQLVAAAGTAIATTAKVGRLLTRSGWGIARRLPGGAALQREVQRLQDAALNEVRRVLDIPEDGPQAATREEARVMMLVQNSHGPDPLRDAMSELLERSVEADRSTSRDYLFGNIISQLVPDEARIMAALSDGTPFAVIDVVTKQIGRATTRTVLANASTIGRTAGVVTRDNVPTYLTRLHTYGLIEFGPPEEKLTMQFDIVAADSAVKAATAQAEARNLGSPKLLRKTMTISQFGREFWAACDPSAEHTTAHTHQ